MTLFNYYMKQAFTFMMSFLFGAFMYLLMIVYIYPTIEKLDGLEEMMKQMPKELNAIFNMSAGLQDINQFIAMEYYGMIFIILMLCFSIMLANNLYGKWIENKSLANILNLPFSRTSIMSQIQTAAIIVHILFGVLMAFACVGLINWIIENPEYDFWNIFHLNVLGTVVFLIIYLFTLTCMLIFNEAKHGLLAASGFALLMYGSSIGSKLSEDVAWMKYFTIFSLYDSAKVSSGDADLLMNYSVSIGIIVLLFIVNLVLFNRKNLSL
ncbi:hypothetical protein [Macrococcoides caseolyticum]|uniref:hypothetical protein n=1 Tax=Macrococcoides caseolyticum TaxID=69966 RepID=UPI001F1CB85F|nr:hypothetical protein [Macrococcus caseolyticus]MCE4956291.1 hypothetical protein [Macrococcus caseolyticus]